MAPRRKKKPLSPEHAALGRAVVELREEAGLTQEQLAERMGTTFTRVGLLERGETDPKFTTLRRLARGLDIKMTKLAGRIEHHFDAAEGKGSG
jgi:transcriptional regulator with XRE-family HTH domain